MLLVQVCLIFFFQAEDGIRDPLVTGVQTCALPICLSLSMLAWGGIGSLCLGLAVWRLRPAYLRQLQGEGRPKKLGWWRAQIGRASCRERVEISVVERGLKKKGQERDDQDVWKADHV